MTDQVSAQNLETLSAELLEKARGAHSGRAARRCRLGEFRGGGLGPAWIGPADLGW
ncbi:hypothetical protein QYM46_08960 [Brevibacterium sp. K11IcPPYGO002]|uniref:hypothetical protein n=1 Tax=Brevibacterium sp. K11IcPPYGO002 TaxID=3058837 RepID=UPI003D817F70